MLTLIIMATFFILLFLFIPSPIVLYLISNYNKLHVIEIAHFLTFMGRRVVAMLLRVISLEDTLAKQISEKEFWSQSKGKEFLLKHGWISYFLSYLQHVNDSTLLLSNRGAG